MEVFWRREVGEEGKGAGRPFAPHPLLICQFSFFPQNRVERGAQAKNSVQESHLPGFLDLVVWGHEHECKKDLEDIRNPDAGSGNTKSAKVLQPGSSVATSLSEGGLLAWVHA
jgi:hypothetical protein